MQGAIEFGYFGETGSAHACGPASAPAFKRALEIARHSFTSLWFADHFMYEDADIHESR